MYSVQRREALRRELLRRAKEDQSIASAAVTGSGAAQNEDAWSDIDLAFGVADSFDIHGVLGAWTRTMYEDHGALHHHDVKAGAWIYRVFLLPDTLQVDLAFVRVAEFRPMGPNFRLEFGAAEEAGSFSNPRAGDLIGLAWLHALHARSSIARGRFWQAEHMIGAVRNYTITLACLSHHLPAAHARGADALPQSVLESLEETLVRSLKPQELYRAFVASVEALTREILKADPDLAERLNGPLSEMTWMVSS